jgi:hypothetical protein
VTMRTLRRECWLLVVFIEDHDPRLKLMTGRNGSEICEIDDKVVE